MAKNEILKVIKIQQIKDSPYQGRFLTAETAPEEQDNGAEIQSLANSISRSGLMQPVVVRETGAGKYELIDGHRRIAAYKQLGLGNIKAIVKPYDERQAQVFAIVGNLQRKNLSTIEMAVTFQKVLDAGVFKDKKELSESVGKDETYVGDVLNTLKMDDRIVADLAKTNAIKDVRMLRLIRNIEPVDDTQTSYRQWALYMKVIKEKLTRPQVARLIKDAHSKKPREKKYEIRRGARHISIKLKTGKLTPDQLERINKILEEKMQDVCKEF